MNLFQVNDVFGKEISLTLERFEHIATGHWDVADFSNVELFKNALQFPDFATKDIKTKAKLFYQKIKNNKYLVIVVMHTNGEGFIMVSRI